MLIRRPAVAVCFFGWMALPLLAQTEPTLDEILKKHHDARGGEAKIAAVKSLRVSGKLILGGGQMEAPMSGVIKRPNYSRMEIEIQGRKIVEAFDGTTKWTINPMAGSTDPQVADEEQTKAAREDADEIDGPLMNYKAKGHAVELLGKEDVEGSPAYKLKITLKSGNIVTMFLDAKNYLPVKSVAKRKQMGQEIEMESYPGAYKQVEGLTMPFTVENKVGGRPMMQIRFDSIELNVPVDDAVFKMPAKAEPKKEEPKKEEVKKP